jgi:hypothetical protein
MVCNFRRFDRSCFADKCQSEKSNGRITGSGHIKDLARLCRNMMRQLLCLEKHHAVFAQGNEQ